MIVCSTALPFLTSWHILPVACTGSHNALSAGNVDSMNTQASPHFQPPSQLRSFVRRGGRMTKAQEQAWQDHSATYLIDVTRSHGITTVAEGSTRHPDELFPSHAPLVVEIGTGAGEAIVHAAIEHPELNFLGIEVYEAGLARTMLNAAKAGLTNLRLIEANAPEVLEHFLPAQSVTEIRVFFPDPWHKARHNKRRLIQPRFTELAANVLVPGGLVRMATDWEEYAEQMRDVFDDAESFRRAFDTDWADRFDGRPITSFERKGQAKGRVIRDLTYVFTPSS